MDTARISELLQPFLALNPGESTGFGPSELENISTYIDLLLRWNARINLTAVRRPEEIVTRHFGESFFAARYLFPVRAAQGQPVHHLIDVGSGAGFPGLPIKIWLPSLRVTLIESNQKKATFLREVIRSLALMDVDVFAGRAEEFSQPASVVTLRAVERFETIVPTTVRLVSADGRLALLAGAAQVALARELAPDFTWAEPTPVPLSSHRVLLIATRKLFDTLDRGSTIMQDSARIVPRLRSD